MATRNPTGLILPSLVYDGLTRTGNDFYLYYNLTPARVIGQAGLDGDGNEIWTPEATCGQMADLPASNIGAIRARQPIKHTSQSEWSLFGADSGILPGYAPTDQGAEIGSIPSLSTIVLGGITIDASPGDSVDVIALPHPSGDVLICYDQGFSADPGTEDKPIPRKFQTADHYVRQRGERTMSIRDMYTNNLEGIAALRNRTVTIIGKTFPNGSAIPSEIRYFTNVRLRVPLESPQDGNESMTVSAEGNYNEQIVFTARRT